MIRKVLSSLEYRWKIAQFGIYHLGSSSFDLSKLHIGPTHIAPSFPEGEEEVLRHELHDILFNDCYSLKTFANNATIDSVLDIGANIGLFSMAARHHFPNASIHAYEPNFHLESFLNAHLEPLDVTYFMEGVGDQDGSIMLSFGNKSLYSTTSATPETSDDTAVVAQTSFRSALDRMGGTADLVKLDCEGAEWEIFEDAASWEVVQHLTMEYHLWARENSTFDDLLRLIEGLGFQCWNYVPSPTGRWGLLQASKEHPSSM